MTGNARKFFFLKRIKLTGGTLAFLILNNFLSSLNNWFVSLYYSDPLAEISLQ